MYRYGMRRFFPSSSTIFLGMAGLFLLLEWLSKQNLIPQVKLPGFDFSATGSMMFLGFIVLSALASLRTAAYFLTIAWIAAFCHANEQYPVLKILADVLYSPRNWVIARFQNTYVPAEDLGLFLTFLIYMLIAYILAKEHEQKVKIVWAPPKM